MHTRIYSLNVRNINIQQQQQEEFLEKQKQFYFPVVPAIPSWDCFLNTGKASK